MRTGPRRKLAPCNRCKRGDAELKGWSSKSVDRLRLAVFDPGKKVLLLRAVFKLGWELVCGKGRPGLVSSERW